MVRQSYGSPISRVSGEKRRTRGVRLHVGFSTTGDRPSPRSSSRRCAAARRAMGAVFLISHTARTEGTGDVEARG